MSSPPLPKSRLQRYKLFLQSQHQPAPNVPYNPISTPKPIHHPSPILSIPIISITYIPSITSIPLTKKKSPPIRQGLLSLITAVSHFQSDTHEYRDLQSAITSTHNEFIVNRGLQIPFSIVADYKSATTNHNKRTSATSGRGGLQIRHNEA